MRGDSASAVTPGKYGTPSSSDSVFSPGFRPISGNVERSTPVLMSPRSFHVRPLFTDLNRC